MDFYLEHRDRLAPDDALSARLADSKPFDPTDIFYFS